MRKILKAIVTAGLIVFALLLLDIDALGLAIQNGRFAYFVIAMFIIMPKFLVLSVRWSLMIMPIVKRPLITHVAIYFKGTFLNAFTPANLGGDAYRFTMLKRQAGVREVVGLLLRERIIGLYGYLIIFAFAYVFLVTFSHFDVSLSQNPFTYGAISAFGMFILLFLFASLRIARRMVALIRSIGRKEFLPKLDGWVEFMHNLLSLNGVIPLMMLTMGGVLLWIVSIKVIGEGFGISISLMHLAAVATLVEIIRLVPITIQGIGLREGVFAYLLAFLGYNVEQCYIVGTIAYLTLSAAIILCGPIGYAIGWLIRCNFSPVLNEERSE